MAADGKERPAKLAGWKEIAAFVGREVRTVQRWERELGLPVHRVPGSHGHSVFANPDEIENWFNRADCSRFPLTRSLPWPVAAQPTASGARPKSSASLPWRFRGRTAFEALAILLVAVVLYASSGRRRMTLLGSGQPVISSVTPILPGADQTIVILGRGLGTYTPFNNLDTPYLAIRNNTAHWAAGRIIPENQDEVTLNVTRWTDSEIVVSGLAGAYGRNNWVLNPSDKIEIAVWNPQTGAGPALFHVQVSPGAGEAH